MQARVICHEMYRDTDVRWAQILVLIVHDNLIKQECFNKGMCYLLKQANKMCDGCTDNGKVILMCEPHYASDTNRCDSYFVLLNSSIHRERAWLQTAPVSYITQLQTKNSSKSYNNIYNSAVNYFSKCWAHTWKSYISNPSNVTAEFHIIEKHVT